MGVTGLWRLIEPAGKPVPIETLENKVLAVDISIWLHQVVKGYQDAKGAPLPNAHLMGLFQRLCKLLYFRIKPVFVFDGGFPELKKETIAKRQDNKTKYNSESERLKREIALLLGKKTVIGSLLGTQISPKKNKNTQSEADKEDIFKLPALPQQEEESETESEDEQDSSASTVDLHTVDIESEDFKNMPVKEKYDLLIELKDTRKMNSWGKLHTLPKKSDNFSDFQMERLLKRRKVQECLQETEKEMGDVGMSLNELESFLNEEGIDTKIENLPTRRIASNNTTRYILINNVQQALADAKKREEGESSKSKVDQITDTKEELEDDLQKAIKMSLECEGQSSKIDKEPNVNEGNKLEEDLEKGIKMSLECVEDPNTSTTKTDDSWTSYKSDTDCPDNGSDSEEGDGYSQPDFSTAKAYIMQYSDFSYNAINDIVASKTKGDNINKKKSQDVSEIIEELNHEKSVIIDNIDLSSDEDEQIQNIDKKKCFGTIPILKGESKLQPIGNIKIENIDTESHLPLEKCIDMNMTQSSVVCIEKSDEVIALDTSADDILEMRHESIKPVITGSVESENQSDTSDDDFEEVSESIKPAVQLTLNIPDAIEDDIFADVFDEKDPNSNTSPITINDKKQLIISDSDIIARKIPKLVNIESNRDANKISNCVQEFVPDEEIKSDTNFKKGDMKNVETNPHDNNPTDSDTHVVQVQTGTEETKSSNERPVNAISTATLNSMVAEIESEEQILVQEKGKMERIGRNITEQMTKEAQELLQIFGIPYIVAPMEAEAQCAFLESVNLTDGTITDDSDIWLFGGRTVYKNFFNQKKHVLQFLSERIEKSYNLSREQLILLALLVGSDYTTGVSGVGPVTALEILASFPFNKKQLLKENSKHGQYQLIVTGLQEFKTWVRAGRRTDNISLKKKLRNVNIGEDFPSVRVVQAYLDPNVEKSEEKFTWGELDITILRDYAKAKFGWSQNKLDVIVQPVIKRMMERKTQKSVKDYFKRKIDFQSLEDHMSKRVKAAVQKMDTGNKSIESATIHNSTDESELTAGSKRKGRTKKQDSTPSTSATGTKSKKKKIDEPATVCTTEGGIEINIVKTDRYQEIIPQREKDMQNILQNKLKAIEIFRKTKIYRKSKPQKKRVNLPKDKAYLSESSDSN